jgi:hypothetical protein
VTVEPEFVPQEIQDMVQRGTLEPNDIYLVQNIVETDDDNEPALENLPQEGQGDPLNIFGEWGGHQGVCHQCSVASIRNQNLSINFSQGVRPTLLQLFELLFPKVYILEVILPIINKEIKFGGSVEYWEFLVFLGIWLLMGTIQEPERKDLRFLEPISEFLGAPF